MTKFGKKMRKNNGGWVKGSTLKSIEGQHRLQKMKDMVYGGFNTVEIGKFFKLDEVTVQNLFKRNGFDYRKNHRQYLYNQIIDLKKQGYSAREIAKILKITFQAVYWRLNFINKI